MKDALGHGSDSRGGASHQEGVNRLGESHLSIQKHDYSAAMGRNWYVRHNATGKSVGDLGFTTRRAGLAFMAQHLDPSNPKWGKPETMHGQYLAARAINLGLR